jgi:hypothetical protein
MSILPPHLLRKTSTESRKAQELSERRKLPEKDFKELLRTQEISEETRKQTFFALIIEDDEEKKENEQAAMATSALNSCPVLLASLDNASLNAIASVQKAENSSQIELLFEKMASGMILMNSSHETETTLILEGPQFASSSLLGTQIVIREFSTAPKIFNIEILSGVHAAAIIELHKPKLLSSFEKGNFNFSVHRLETLVKQEPFCRKEKEEGDKSP